jgi:hypothetical protein
LDIFAQFNESKSERIESPFQGYTGHSARTRFNFPEIYPDNASDFVDMQLNTHLEFKTKGDVMEQENDGVIRSADKNVDGKVLPKREIDALKRQPGEPLPDYLRSELESELGADLSGVRVHINQDSFRAAHSLGARAFTHGNDVYFSSAQYDPNTATGKHMLSHELAHVIQQTTVSED